MASDAVHWTNTPAAVAASVPDRSSRSFSLIPNVLSALGIHVIPDQIKNIFLLTNTGVF